MNPDEVRDLITGGSLTMPYTIHTKDGESYTVEHASNAHIFGEYPDTLIVAIPRRGFVPVRLDSIEAVTPLSTGPASAGEEPR